LLKFQAPIDLQSLSASGRYRRNRLVIAVVSRRVEPHLERDDFYLNRWDSRIGIEVIQP
jgi:hypothetical protein